jgi:hypothetical protein
MTAMIIKVLSIKWKSREKGQVEGLNGGGREVVTE